MTNSTKITYLQLCLLTESHGTLRDNVLAHKTSLIQLLCFMGVPVLSRETERNIFSSCFNFQWPHFTYIYHCLYTCSRREYTVDKSVLSSELCFSSSIWAMLLWPKYSNFYSAVTSHCLCCPVAPAFLYFILYFVALVVLSSENALTLFVWLRSKD
jgi:hypothetical protein